MPLKVVIRMYGMWVTVTFGHELPVDRPHITCDVVVIVVEVVIAGSPVAVVDLVPRLVCMKSPLCSRVEAILAWHRPNV